MAGKVTCIPATKNRFMALPVTSVSKRRVAAYARVSTDSDEQFTSYAAQIDYYTNYIQQHPEWEFVKVYTDEGISGLNTRHRDGFNEMIVDALAGKIDLIVTKSVSRFARNTVDSLTTIRKLKEQGVECYFEKEGIYTFDGKGELLLTIMSSLAQEETAFPKTSHGVCGSALPTARSAWHTNNSSDMKKAPMGHRLSMRRKPKSSA